ncbi:hypothetical protein SHAM105786_06210 [Shewanella amazonensis]|uniref:Lipoprotein n=1 Tax=Shewanella amazonensis (strain ATCC BAA-1098 / SB2B) TaxID=326297 RepID=A1S9J8_SHEAM|nr:hypothetical protein [Shewanella amazonensis]ABM01055.1 hypothetical protein Sama_2852 [Shewanella amazonensis SB2B]
MHKLPFSAAVTAPLLALMLTACGATDKPAADKTPTNAGQTAETPAPETAAAPAAPTAPAAPEVKVAPAPKAAPVAKAEKIAGDGVLYILTDIPYNPESNIVDKVELECTELGRQFADSIVKYGNKQKLKIKRVDELPAQGNAVKITIDNVYSEGNANPFNPHRKHVAATAVLVIDGEETKISDFSRFSTGGMWGGFKGSCSVLQHTVNTLGNDVAKWLKKYAG